MSKYTIAQIKKEPLNIELMFENNPGTEVILILDSKDKALLVVAKAEFLAAFDGLMLIYKICGEGLSWQWGLEVQRGWSQEKFQLPDAPGYRFKVATDFSVETLKEQIREAKQATSKETYTIVTF